VDLAKKLVLRLTAVCLPALPALLSGCAFFPLALTGASFALPQYASLALTGAKVLHKSALIAADESHAKEMLTDKVSSMKAQAILYAEGAPGVDAFCFNDDLYLVGEIDKTADRERILARLAGLSGVRGVKGLLKERVENPLPAASPDSSLERTVQTALLKKLLLKSANIDARVVQGEVVLVGVVRDKAEEAEIVRHLRSLEGFSETPVTSILALQEEFERKLPASNARFALLAPAKAEPLPASPLDAPSGAQGTALAEVRLPAAAPAVSELRAPVAKPQWNKARLKVNERLLALARAESDPAVREDLSRLARDVLTDTDFSIRDRLSAAAGVCERERTAQTIHALLASLA